MYSEEFQNIVEFRRSNRSFDPSVEIPDKVIENSIKRGILAPNSSNMQLWEFYWIKSREELNALVPLCLDQSAAKTAKHMVVFVTRRDLWRSRAKWNYEKINSTIDGTPNTLQKRGLDYYKKLIPFIYLNDPLHIVTFFRRTVSFFGGLSKPFYRLGALWFISPVPLQHKHSCFPYLPKDIIRVQWKDLIRNG